MLCRHTRHSTTTFWWDSSLFPPFFPFFLPSISAHFGSFSFSCSTLSSPSLIFVSSYPFSCFLVRYFRLRSTLFVCSLAAAPRAPSTEVHPQSDGARHTTHGPCLALAVHLLVRRRSIRRGWRVVLVHVAAVVFGRDRGCCNTRCRRRRVLVLLVAQRRQLPAASIGRCRLGAIGSRLARIRVAAARWPTRGGSSGGGLALPLLLGLALSLLLLFARLPFFADFLELCTEKEKARPLALVFVVLVN